MIDGQHYLFRSLKSAVKSAPDAFPEDLGAVLSAHKASHNHLPLLLSLDIRHECGSQAYMQAQSSYT